ncbi:hypothetical protein AVEN_176356-1 [Araneus ventricosus]|uniref:DUF4371 domain-containing protein n=1 Tax=Araneus ventricosus TaxID=182803 RepID=A0A4Y2C8V9_ARAVE|nr:hypothetical protein AVEN_176356-1 [Araneus ventricosus]
MGDSRRKVIIEELVSLVKEPGSEYIGHVSVNFGRAQIIGNHIYSFLSYVDNDIDITKLVAIGCDGTSVNTGIKGGIIRNMELILNSPLQWFMCQLHAKEGRTLLQPLTSLSGFKRESQFPLHSVYSATL